MRHIGDLIAWFLAARLLFRLCVLALCALTFLAIIFWPARRRRR